MNKMNKIYFLLIIIGLIVLFGCIQSTNNDFLNDINNIDSNDSSLKPVHENCTSWFDGCNYCSWDAMGFIICTQMYCEEHGESYCID